MEFLPKDALFAIAINLGLEDLLNLCNSSNRINRLVCQKDDIWLYKIKQEFPYLTQEILNRYKNTRSWREYYIQDLEPTTNDNSNDVLIKSSRNGRLDLVIIALNLGADINRYNLPITLSSLYGHLDVVKYLVECGIDVSDPEFEGLTEASFSGHLDVVKYLVEKGAIVQADDNVSIHYANENGHYDVVKYLLDHGAQLR